ncbi:hypothetical protein DRQ25_13755 [Candidatus Fermentibacteria bacterium]|nr:MAG: hypothetical protein DRQ25_13755 [Candidatus Fermentibacteria bacterium]
MSKRPLRIIIDGAYAKLRGGGESLLRKPLRVLDPKRFFKPAFQQGWWDGYIALYEGNTFPAGLTKRVADSLVGDGYEVDITEKKDTKPLDLSRFDETYLPGITLWEPQMGAIMAMLTNARGIVKSPTGSGKTEDIYAVARYYLEEQKWRSLVIVPKAGLLKQTVKRFVKYTQGDFEIGQLGDGKKTVGPITVGTAQCLMNYKSRKIKNQWREGNKLLADVIQHFEILFLDEAHHTGSTSWYDIAMNMGNTQRRFGLSGTPLKDDESSDLRLVGATGALIFNAEAQDLIEQGLAARPKIAFIVSHNASGPKLPMNINEIILPNGDRVSKPKYKPYSEAYALGVVENSYHNTAVIRAVEWLVERKKQTIILCRRKLHFQTLKTMLEDSGITFEALWGDDSTDIRERAKHEFGERAINVILATTIFDEGEDVPNIEAIVLAEGVKSQVNVVQRIGRGMRKDTEDVWVVDIAPTCHPRLVEHAVERADAYEEEGHEVIVLDEWPAVDELFDPDRDYLPFENWDEAYANR